MLERFRKRIRELFTKVVVEEERFDDLRGKGDKKALVGRRRRKPHKVAIPPSERFVWSIAALIICLVSVVVLEGIYIVVTGKLSTELLTVISGLTGSLTTAFFMGNKK